MADDTTDHQTSITLGEIDGRRVEVCALMERSKNHCGRQDRGGLHRDQLSVCHHLAARAWP